MYFSSFDAQNALLVARLAAGGDQRADFPEHIERMVTASEETAGHDKTLCILVLFDREHVLPTPAIRRAVADATARDDFVPNIAIVSGNPLVRGVVAALSWLRKPKFAIKVFGNTGYAIAWLQKQRGEPLPELAAMVAELTGRGLKAAG